MQKRTIVKNNNENWKQLSSFEISEEQENILNGEDEDARIKVLNEIENNRYVLPAEEDVIAAEEILQNKLPENHIFIHASVTLPNKFGIINCRDNKGQHVQIRFE